MGRITTLLLLFIMIFTEVSNAQKIRGITMQWRIGAQLPGNNGLNNSIGFAGPVIGVHQNMLLVAGGANFPDSMPWLGGRKKYYDDVYMFSKKDDSISLYPKRYKLAEAIAYSANCSTSKGIFYGGGENEKGISKKTGLLIWDNKKDSFQIKSLPDLPIPLANASCTHVGNMVYLAGGETTDAVSDLFLKLDLNYIEDGWKQLPSLPKQISHAVMLTQSTGRKDCIYLFGGRKKNASGISDLYNTVFEFDTRKNKWKQKESIPYSLSAGSGIATGTNNFLLFGGDKGQTFNQTEKLIHAINREKNENIKQELNKQKIELQTNHPGFSNEVLLYNVISNTWSVVGAIPFDTPVTTTACFWDKDIVIPNGEIKAGVRTPQLLIGNLISK